MKSIIMLCSLFLILSFIDTVFSYSNGKTRFYDIIRKSMNKNSDVLLAEVRLYKLIRPHTTASMSEPSDLMENNEEINNQKRDSWDSGEEQYFKWASLNRRPMESLVGRKRLAEVIVPGSRPTRIGGGIWRSGLVG